MKLSSSHQTRQDLERSITLFLLLDCVAFILDVISAYFSNSLALSSEVIRTFIEVLAIFISLILVKHTHKQNQKYTYGLGKLENFGSIIIALSLIVSFYFIMHHAIIRYQDPEPLHGVELGLFFNTLYLIKNIWFYRRIVRLIDPEYSSCLVDAQKRAYLICAIVNAGLVFTLSLNYLFPHIALLWLLDSLMSMLIAGFILLSAFQTLTHSIGDLIDKALNESAQYLITQILFSNACNYAQYHGMRSRQSGDKRFIEIFLEFDLTLLMRDVQTIINKLQYEIESALPGAVVSIVPTTQRIDTL